MNVCSVDRDIPSLHYPALPCLQLNFISLAYTNFPYTREPREPNLATFFLSQDKFRTKLLYLYWLVLMNAASWPDSESGDDE
jgi:hypothetical protein